MTSRQSSDAINLLLRKTKRLGKPTSVYGTGDDFVFPRLGFPTVLVASKDASTPVRNFADYVCDGSSDEEEINAALESVSSSWPQGGRVFLSKGLFQIDNPIIMDGIGQMLVGTGYSTNLQAPNQSSIIIQYSGIYCVVRDIYFSWFVV